MNSKNFISGIQQIGIGVSNVDEAFRWYKKHFGTDVVVFDEKAPAEYMLPYTGGEPRDRHAILALNMQGGGGFEIWQHKGFEPRSANFEIQPGDYGVFICKIKTRDAKFAHDFHTKLAEAKNISSLYTDGLGRKYYYITDPYNNIFQVLEIKDKEAWFCKEDPNKYPTGGVYGAVVGCKNIDQSIAFYKDVLGYDKIAYDTTANFEDLAAFDRKDCSFRRVVLQHSAPRQGVFSKFMSYSEIELIEAINPKVACRKIFENRFWGELGFIQICYDISSMNTFRERCKELGYSFTVDSMKLNPNFDMGEASGHFSYNEDPSGTLIEYVETIRIPILKKFGIFLNLSKKKNGKALPNFVVRALRFLRK